MTNDQLRLLVEAVAADRDRGAFADLFRHFAPRLKGFGLRSGIDGTAADELVQETMLAVWSKAGTFDSARATVSTWVFTIVRNKRIDMFRRQDYPAVELDEALDVAGREAPADECLVAVQAGAALHFALKTLPAEQLEIMRRAYFEEKSHRAIADEMRLPLGTVKSRIRLALVRLRALMPESQV
ncbi:MAG: sigma-70 family RNA polymerase sigma factor [Rhodospirillales bacterium]